MLRMAIMAWLVSGLSFPAWTSLISQKTLAAKYTKAIPGLVWTKMGSDILGRDNREGIFVGLTGDPVKGGSVTFRLVDWEGHPLSDRQIYRRVLHGAGLLRHLMPKWKEGRAWLEDIVIVTLRDLTKGKMTTETKKEVSGWRVTVLGMSVSAIGGDDTIMISVEEVREFHTGKI